MRKILKNDESRNNKKLKFLDKLVNQLESLALMTYVTTIYLDNQPLIEIIYCQCHKIVPMEYIKLPINIIFGYLIGLAQSDHIKWLLL